MTSRSSRDGESWFPNSSAYSHFTSESFRMSEAQRAHEARDQDELNSNPQYPQPTQSQYPHPQSSYGYPASDYPSISEHDLAITSQPYPPPIPIATQLQDAAANARASNGESMRINTNGAAGLPDMGPPQAQGTQGFSPEPPRPSVDATPTSATPGDQKGKRGKASQACDECRRKKTKCITSIDEDGIPTTCNSCAKAGIECTYSRQPMKRGPNKGYIKDLADRVQQVESMLPTFRGSFDGDIFGTPGEEAMSGRRNYSLPGGRASFSGPDFSRSDRFGSFSAYPTATSQPARQRDRFSIAVPPDQSAPSNVANLYDEIERPAKRIKMDFENSSLVPIQIETDDLAKYYELIHPQFPVLPDAVDTAITIMSQASCDLQHAIVTVVSLLPNTANSQENDYKQKSGIRTVHDMVDRLSNALNGIASAADILVFIWTAAIFIQHAEYAIDVYDISPMPTHALVRKNLELLPLISDPQMAKFVITAEKASALGIELQVLEDAAARARSMAMLQTKLNLMATGRLLPNLDNIIFLGVADVAQAIDLAPSARFLAYATKTLAWTGSLLASLPPSARRETTTQRNATSAASDQLDHAMQQNVLSAISDQLDHAAMRASIEPNDSLFLQLEEFVKLMTTRMVSMSTPLACLFPAAKLAELLKSPSSTSSPLEVHLFTSCVFTFLEVLAFPSPSSEEWASPVAQTGLSSVRPILNQKAAEHRASRSAAAKTFWGTHNGKQVLKLSWAEALSDHIDACEAVNWVNTSVVDRHVNEVGRPDVSANFQQLVSLGYLTILSYYARNMVRNEMDEAVAAGAAAAAAAVAATAAGGLEEAAA